MAAPEIETRTVARRAGDWLNLLAFAYRVFIAPWPPFAVLIVAVAVAATATPIALVWITTALVDGIAGAVADGGVEGSFLSILSPHLPGIGLLFLLRYVQHMAQNDALIRLMALQLSLRSLDRLETSFFLKSTQIRLEWFEYPEYHDGTNSSRSGFRPSKSVCSAWPTIF